MGDLRGASLPDWSRCMWPATVATRFGRCSWRTAPPLRDPGRPVFLFLRKSQPRSNLRGRPTVGRCARGRDRRVVAAVDQMLQSSGRCVHRVDVVAFSEIAKAGEASSPIEWGRPTTMFMEHRRGRCGDGCIRGLDVAECALEARAATGLTLAGSVRDGARGVDLPRRVGMRGGRRGCRNAHRGHAKLRSKRSTRRRAVAYSRQIADNSDRSYPPPLEKATSASSQKDVHHRLRQPLPFARRPRPWTKLSRPRARASGKDLR